MICPCKGCDKAGCGAYHDECERYKEWDKSRQLAATRRQMSQDVTDAVVRGKLRIKKQKGRVHG